ncbi:MAG: protocatechuate 3,4-dioxygenase subunit alpha [Deltaproteobacteria bacterium]
MKPRYPGCYDLYGGQTPEQTLGPFFSQGLVRVADTFASPSLCRDAEDVIGNVLASELTPGERLRLEGTVYDGLGCPIPDALVEIWQADAEGRYAHPLQLGEQFVKAPFQGFGRAPTDDGGRFFFETIRPGAVPGPGGSAQAAHLNVVLGARGMTRLAFTRIYFADDPALARDPVLGQIPAARRATLLARRRLEAPGRPTYVFDIHLQGELETVFFDF